MKTYFRILNFVRPISKYVVPYFFCVVLYAIFNTFNFVLIVPILDALFSPEQSQAVTTLPEFSLSTQYVSQLINYHLFRNHDGQPVSAQDVLVFLSMIIIASVFISNLFRFLSQKITENFRIQTLRNIRNAMFSNVMSLNVRYFTNERKGDILSKLTSDITIVQYTISSTLQVAFKEPLLIIAYFVALLAISVDLTIFTLIFMPITAGIIGFIIKKLRYYALNSQSSLGEMLSIAEEALSSIKVVKSYNIASYIISLFTKENDKYSEIQRKMATRQQMASPMSEFLGVSAIAVVLIYGGGLVTEGSLQASQFMAYIAIFSQIARPARALADAFSQIHQGIAAGERVLEIIDKQPEITDDPQSVKITAFKENISFNDVRFAYEDHEVIKGINFTVNKGETVALVGASGGGKSTVLDLISRYYDVSSGNISIDGTDIRRYNLESLRQLIGTVSQEVILFNDTIYNNIRLGNLAATEEEIIRAAKIANAYDFIMEAPEGFNTNIGDRGAKLSGGQRQRISIARAVLKNPEILILDEATSALDTQSEKLVQQALNSLLENRTSIVVAHRLSTIQKADKIIVIDRGVIVEEGTHQSLIEKDGYYKRLIDMQKV